MAAFAERARVELEATGATADAKRAWPPSYSGRVR
jgi:hypothetical protein